jgi:hypothetical protein
VVDRTRDGDPTGMYFCLHVSKFPEGSRMPAKQPTLPGFTPRGRPRSGMSPSERLRLYQAERRRTSVRRPLSVEVDALILARFKSEAFARGLKLRDAVESALIQWENLSESTEVVRMDYEGK